jgi:hypothetical protein
VEKLKSLQYCVLSGNQFSAIPAPLLKLPMKELYVRLL